MRKALLLHSVTTVTSVRDSINISPQSRRGSRTEVTVHTETERRPAIAITARRPLGPLNLMAYIQQRKIDGEEF